MNILGNYKNKTMRIFFNVGCGKNQIYSLKYRKKDKNKTIEVGDSKQAVFLVLCKSAQVG